MNMINGPNNQVNNGAHIEQAAKQTDKFSSSEAANFFKAANEKARTESKNNSKEQLDPQAIADAVDKANKLVLIFDKSTRFVYNQKLGINFVDIVDNYTNEVIKQIPSEDMRRFMEAVENAVGMIVDEKA